MTYEFVDASLAYFVADVPGYIAQSNAGNHVTIWDCTPSHTPHFQNLTAGDTPSLLLPHGLPEK